MSNQFFVELDKNQVLCREGDLQTDLYLIQTGKLMVCVTKGSEVIPLAYLAPGEFIGELSFFDNSARSANIIAVEQTRLVKIPQAELKKQFPPWLIMSARFMTKKLRTFNEVLKRRGIKRRNLGGIRPLNIDEQRTFYELIAKKD